MTDWLAFPVLRFAALLVGLTACAVVMVLMLVLVVGIVILAVAAAENQDERCTVLPMAGPSRASRAHLVDALDATLAERVAQMLGPLEPRLPDPS